MDEAATPAPAASPAPAPVQAPVASAPKAAPPLAPKAAPGPAGPVQPNPQQARLDSMAKLEAEQLRLKRDLQTAQDRVKALEPDAVKLKNLLERAKTEPFAVMQETGMSYAQITEHILKSEQEPPDPIKAAVEPLQKELKDLKTEREREAAAQQQAQLDGQIRAFKTEIAKVVDNSEEYPALSFIPERTEIVWQVINQHWAATQKALSAQEAATLADAFYLDIASKWKGSEKVQARLEQLALAASEAAREAQAAEEPPASKPKAAPAKTPPASKAPPKPGLSNKLAAAAPPKRDPSKMTKEERMKEIAARMSATA